ALEVRKHHIRLTSDTITEAKYQDVCKLDVLADDYANLTGNLEQLAYEEYQEAQLVAQKNKLKKKLGFSKLTKDERASFIEILKKTIKYQEGQITKLTQDYAKWRIEDSRADLKVQLYQSINSGGAIRHDGLGYYAPGGWWNDQIESVYVPPGLKVTLYQHGNKGGRSVTIHGEKRTNLWRDNIDNEASSWYVTTSIGNDNPEHIRNTFKNVKNRLSKTRQLVLDLKETLKLLEGGEDAQKKIDEIDKTLETVREKLKLSNSAFTGGLASIQTTAQKMRQLSKDIKGLTTYGSLLEFLQPATRLNMLETCEGNVQVDYFNAQGQMQSTLYDAASGGTDGTFEEWKVDGLRTCLNFTGTSSIATLTTPIQLEKGLTLETWFLYPFAQSQTWRVLTSSQDGNEQVVIYQDNYLGLRLDGLFYGCDYTLESLHPGWHHLAVRGENATQATSFFLDGEEIGKKANSKNSLVFSGQDEYLELKNALDLDLTGGLTIEVWVHYERFQYESRIIDWEIGDSTKKIDVILGNREKSNTLMVVVDEELKEFEGVLELEQWTHLAITYLPMTPNNWFTVYKNGVLLEATSTTSASKATDPKNFIGKSNSSDSSHFKGQMAELRLWDRLRTDLEIQTTLGEILDSQEPGLVGYWKFAQDAIATNSISGGTAYNATIEGKPEAFQVVHWPARISSIYALGNAPESELASKDTSKQNVTTTAGKEPPIKTGLQVYLTGESLDGNDWKDASGEENHAYTAPNYESAQPFDVADYKQTGKSFKVARFNAQGGMMLSPTFTLEKPFTIFIVDRYYGDVQGRTLQSQNSNWLLGKLSGDNACYMTDWNGSYPAKKGEFTLSTATLEDNRPRWYTNGELHAESGGATAPGQLGFCNGGLHKQSSEADIACVLIYDRVLSLEERYAVENWLGDRYGLPIYHPNDNSALRFDGTTAWIKFPYSPPSLADEITIEFWAKGGSKLPGQTTLFEAFDSNNIALSAKMRYSKA
ncbi:MAG: hypothetical protein F6J87_13805, partial [Spirulina sp. SIO3F2]|nr:hypothetical protein [Spirulina sp. SIO3F2]